LTNLSVVTQSREMERQEDGDWRLQGQERWLSSATLFWRSWRESRPGWDHDHCAFCWKKIAPIDMPDTLHEGYTTDDEYYWVCASCAADFTLRFGFTLKGGPNLT
jgi:hypothetical protein